jgi:hypothetical protein
MPTDFSNENEIASTGLQSGCYKETEDPIYLSDLKVVFTPY